MDLDDIDITQCRVCGKLFRTEAQKGLCRECYLERDEDGGFIQPVSETNQPITATEVHTNQSENNQAPHSPDTIELSQEPLPGDALVCVRCNSRPTIQDSDFCLKCQVALFSDLGEAATELFAGNGIPENHASTAGLASAVEDKRDRAPTRRMNPVTIGRLKT